MIGRAAVLAMALAAAGLSQTLRFDVASVKPSGTQMGPMGRPDDPIALAEIAMLTEHEVKVAVTPLPLLLDSKKLAVPDIAAKPELPRAVVVPKKT